MRALALRSTTATRTRLPALDRGPVGQANRPHPRGSLGSVRAFVLLDGRRRANVSAAGSPMNASSSNTPSVLPQGTTEPEPCCEARRAPRGHQ
jgi:hypothetical protein